MENTFQTGRIHIYYGDGKGKTTAAMGLALRMLGAGGRVTIVQFLKDGQSSELEPLGRLGAVICSGKPGMKFTWEMTEAEKQETARMHTALLQQALETPCDLLVLDEICGAMQLQMVDPVWVERAISLTKIGTEVVLTGRDPAAWIREQADYMTEMRAEKHPFEKGEAARRGIEY